VPPQVGVFETAAWTHTGGGEVLCPDDVGVALIGLQLGAVNELEPGQAPRDQVLGTGLEARVGGAVNVVDDRPQTPTLGRRPRELDAARVAADAVGALEAGEVRHQHARAGCGGLDTGAVGRRAAVDGAHQVTVGHAPGDRGVNVGRTRDRGHELVGQTAPTL